MCVDFVKVHYQPERGSLMMYTVDSTTATSATLPNLQCNTEYTIWVHVRGGQINRTNSPRMVSLYTQQKQIGCFNHSVVALVADKLKRQWLCIVYLLIA